MGLLSFISDLFAPAEPTTEKGKQMLEYFKTLPTKLLIALNNDVGRVKKHQNADSLQALRYELHQRGY